jgi:hypothetical protein
VICAAIPHCKSLLRLKFLLSTIVGAHPHRSNAKKHERILEMVSDYAAAAEVGAYITAGFDVTEKRFLNGVNGLNGTR